MQIEGNYVIKTSSRSVPSEIFYAHLPADISDIFYFDLVVRHLGWAKVGRDDATTGRRRLQRGDTFIRCVNEEGAPAAAGNEDKPEPPRIRLAWQRTRSPR